MTYAVENAGAWDELRGPALSMRTSRLGAELFSLSLSHPAYGTTGLLLNDGEIAPGHAWWNSHAPFLFPIVGGLVNNTSRLRDGRTVSLKNHGFARTSVFTKRDQGANASSAWIEYAFDDSSVAPGCYPWKFFFSVRYELAGLSLAITMRVTNNDDDPMWYQLGWHPGFKTPLLAERGKKSDARLILPEGMYTLYECDDDSFLTGRKERKKLGGEFPVTEDGLARTYVLDMQEIENRTAALHDPNAGITLTLSFPDLPHLGMWSDGPFICLEPWQGCDDYAQQTVFEEKFGIVSLGPGKSDTRKIMLSVSLNP